MQEPENVVRWALNAMNRGEWARVAELTDPEELERWYRDLVEYIEPELSPVTAAFLREHRPDLPDTVAQWQADEINRSRADQGGAIPGQFADSRGRLSPPSRPRRLWRVISWPKNRFGSANNGPSASTHVFFPTCACPGFTER